MPLVVKPLGVQDFEFDPNPARQRGNLGPSLTRRVVNLLNQISAELMSLVE